MCNDTKDTTSTRLVYPLHRPPQPINVGLLSRLTDAHCHPSDDDAGYDRTSEALSQSRLGHICAMSSNLENQETTEKLGHKSQGKVRACYGIHPWFIHPISLAHVIPSKREHYSTLFLSHGTRSDSPSLKSKAAESDLETLLPTLPEPVLLSDVLSSIESRLLADPDALVGEIGLDKAFRIPNPETVHPRNSSLQTPISHQLAVVEAQLALAVRLNRHVSFHSVRAARETVQLLERFRRRHGSTNEGQPTQRREVNGFGRIHICLHSFGGSPETAIQLQRVHGSTLYFSFATAISGRSPRFYDLVRAIDRNHVLVESDYSDSTQLDEQVWQAVQAIDEAQSSSTESAQGQDHHLNEQSTEESDRLAACVDRLEANWKRFMTLEPERSEMSRPDHNDDEDDANVDAGEGDQEWSAMTKKQRKLMKQQIRNRKRDAAATTAIKTTTTTTSAGAEAGYD